MIIGICSGYFQRFHEGHKTYIKNALKKSDKVIVIVNNDKQQQTKYKGFENIKSSSLIAKEIKNSFPNVEIIKSIDNDESVCETLKEVYRQKNSDDILYFFKDADRNLKNIPEAELLKKLEIKLYQLHNKKENSSRKIMEGGQ